MSRRDQLFETITTEGALLPSDFLQRLSQRDRDIAGLTPDAYHLGGGEKLNEAISRSWNRLLGVWKNFSAASQALAPTDAGTTLTREKWLLPLFQELGYGRLQTAKPFEFDDRKYSISHGWQAALIHLVSFRADLDERSESIVGARRSTPHSMVQEFLNRSDAHLWGIVSNGLRLRLLRDNVSITRQAYVEFDLEGMMQGELYADFALLWLLLHQSRVEGERPELCWLEKWTREARQQGERVLDHMRDGVQDAITALGQGFLAHPANTALRDRLRSGELTTQDYFRQLLRVVYRLLFLCIAEDRDLLHAPGVSVTARERYRSHYSITRLRRMAQLLGGTQHSDLWHIVQLIVRSLGSKDGCPTLGLTGLGSFLWSERATPALADCQLPNRQLLQSIRSLAYTQQGRFRRPVDYKNIGSQEFGSVYESLLEQHPKINLDAATFTLGTHAGNERKTSGSHYTPPPLVNCLLDSALEPVLQERERDFAKLGFKSAEEAILGLKVCDEAVGSGHFLIGAAHRIAKRLAAVRTGDGEPAPAAIRHALRDVIGRCLYGVDINPMAVELCKFALWLEALEPGKPLSFLDHHIQCGNALLGATPALMAQGIPDAAFEPIEGDDKKYCANFKKENRKELRQDTLFDRHDRPWEHLGNLTVGIAQLASLPDNSVADVHAKEKIYAELVRSSSYESGRQLADAWCAAFVWKKCPPSAGGFDYPITNDIFQKLERNPHDAPKWMRDEIKRLAGQYQFFHWHLAFPDVFRVPVMDGNAENELSGMNGGFDCILGNPPWEKINLKDEEFFAESHPHIANAANKAERKKLLELLKVDEPHAFARYETEKEIHDRTSVYFRFSGFFPLTGVSRINLYSVFCETALRLLATRGRFGLVLASGIVTDDNNKALFSSLIENQQLVRAWDFENSAGIFPSVHRSYKFLLLCASGREARHEEADFAFYLSTVEELSEPERHFTLTAEELRLLNPNSRTCPTFRNKREAEINKRIYRTVPAWVLHEQTQEWPGIPKTPFNMSNDSGLFINSDKLAERPDGGTTYLPVYESKFIHQFNHRFATFSSMAEEGANEITLPQLQNADVSVASRYWLESRKLNDRYPGRWFLVYRMIARATDERTAIACIIPQRPSVNSVSIIEHLSALTAAVQAAEVNSFAHDYCARQKVSGTNFNHWIWHQLPVLPLARVTASCPWAGDSTTLQTWLLPRVLELTYTAWDLEPFAVDCGWSGPPFRWDEERRFLLRCELDAAFFHLYGLNRDDTAYILDTFPIVKRKDEAKFNGDYRTKRVILEIYDAMKSAMDSGQPYQTLLNPPPADPRCCHPPKAIAAKLELPTGARKSAPNPQVYLMQLTILLLHRNQGTLSLDRMLDACALLSLPDMLVEHAVIEFGEVAKRWRSRFRDKIQPELFLPVLRDFIDRGVIRLKREGNGTLVVLADASAVPKSAEVEFDAGLALGVVNSMAMPELEVLPEMVTDDELEEFSKVG